MKPSHENSSSEEAAMSAPVDLAGNHAARKAAKAATVAACGVRAVGATPSITAPANSIRPLRHRVDSLYLSFQGGIDPDLAVLLQECKLKAQSINEHAMSLAGIGVGDHQFMVLPRGRGRFAACGHRRCR